MKQERVIIMGAGVAGMLAARLLSEQFDKVTLVDPAPGKVVQSGQLHVLLAGGMEILEQSFPQTFQKLSETCPKIDWGGDSYWHSPVGVMPAKKNGVVTYTSTRAYLGELMFEELQQSSVKIVEAKVTGLSFSDDPRQVNAVETSVGKLEADLVVCAMGRTTKVHDWLEQATGEKVKSTIHETSLQYTTAMGEFVEKGDVQQAYLQIDTQKESYGGVILPVENGKVIATSVYIEPEQGEMFSHISDDKFLQILGRLKLDEQQRKVSQLHNVTRHYEKYSTLPQNLYLIGDCVCQLNPVFGQGMTQAMNAAGLLGKYLNGKERRAQSFQKELAQINAFPWMMATIDPYNAKVKLGFQSRMARSWAYKQMRLAKKDDQFRTQFIRVLHLLDSPLRLSTPRWLIKTLLS